MPSKRDGAGKLRLPRAGGAGFPQNKIRETGSDMEGYKVCVYAIAKDEAKFAARWAESMSEADAVYVLDTGSSDDTVKILQAHG